MRRLVLLWVVVLAAAWLACGDDETSIMEPPDDEPTIDLSAFKGCWHVRSGITVLGPEGTPCRAAVDSIVSQFLDIDGDDSLFVRVDSLNHLTFVEPYRGTGDFAGSNIPPGGYGTIRAVYRHGTELCSLVTTFEGSIYALGDDGFAAPYSMNVHFDGDTTCTSLGSCSAFVLFEGTRRPDESCEP